MADNTIYIIPGSGPKQQKVITESDKPVGFEQLAVSNTAVGFASIPANADKAVMTVEDGTLRYRDDGSNPTSTVGLRVFIAGTIILNSRDSLDNFKAIREAANNSELNISYYERR